jgi:DHA1 family tetracycline resistance protein-like MFS transporter
MGYRYNWQEREVGLVLAGVGVAAMIVQGGLIRPVVGAVGEKNALVLGLLMGAIGFWIYGFAPTGKAFLIGVPVMALWGLAQPSASALMTQEVGAEEQGRLQGANSSLMGLSGLAGPWLFALSFAYAIDPSKGLNAPGLPFYAASVLMAVGVIAAAGLRSAGKIAAGRAV